MEIERLTDGYAISDLNIAGGLLCAAQLDNEGKPVLDVNENTVPAFSYGGLRPRKRGSGYLFLIKGDTSYIHQRIDDWFHGKVHDDLRKFAEKTRFLKAQIFAEKRQEEINKKEIEDGHTVTRDTRAAAG